MSSLDLAVIGNCMIAALVDRRARIVWCCFPRFDGDPVFCDLLDGGRKADDGSGSFAIELVGQCPASRATSTTPPCWSRCLRTATTTRSRSSISRRASSISTARSVRPLIRRRCARCTGGRASACVLRPRFDWGAREPELTRGCNHLRFVGPSQTVRLTTDAPMSYVVEETPFAVDRPMSFFFGADEPLRSETDATAREFLEDTTSILARLGALALHPVRLAGSGDPRRDHAEALQFRGDRRHRRGAHDLHSGGAGHRAQLGLPLSAGCATPTSSSRRSTGSAPPGRWRTISAYIANIVDDVGQCRADSTCRRSSASRARPTSRSVSRPALPGYRGMGPVRVGNAAYTQCRTTSTARSCWRRPIIFFDQRLIRPGDERLFDASRAARTARAVAVFDQPDAGPWELRTKASVHTFSSVMCWAACDRLARIAPVLGRDDRARIWRCAGRPACARSSKRAP